MTKTCWRISMARWELHDLEQQNLVKMVHSIPYFIRLYGSCRSFFDRIVKLDDFLHSNILNKFFSHAWLTTMSSAFIVALVSIVRHMFVIKIFTWRVVYGTKDTPLLVHSQTLKSFALTLEIIQKGRKLKREIQIIVFIYSSLYWKF